MIRRGVKTSHPSFMWLLFVVLFFSWIVSDLALRLIGRNWDALPWFSLAYLFADMSPCIFVLFALSYTRGFHAMERQHAWIVALLVLPQVFSWVRATVSALTYVPVTEGCPGTFDYCDFQETSRLVLHDDWYFFSLAITLMLFIVGFIILMTPHKDRRTPAYRREIRYILGGMA